MWICACKKKERKKETGYCISIRPSLPSPSNKKNEYNNKLSFQQKIKIARTVDGVLKEKVHIPQNKNRNGLTVITAQLFYNPPSMFPDSWILKTRFDIRHRFRPPRSFLHPVPCHWYHVNLGDPWNCPYSTYDWDELFRRQSPGLYPGNASHKFSFFHATWFALPII